ncbi:nitrate/nitrite two-component system sensor histidine kinase NarQ [Vibrio parahaemolyticus]|uniref:nitrate/nitrite two-component system sensor histidine kinase NarQ n=1 Tax=Vibrio parahaemolyticus TaxID=670 RepID=UPI00111DB45B|nr:nitrate/nitrite two-component system sensor histidine kinase NarQ [Vibrio parahaemolyticus]ELA8128414.1 nitrate/nitrite two-component system sensor histidine kinase NarQ [Vibrio parahaemolyticus]TOK56267.1 nitrate/nitrite two-component system sensor histidine kinase NarQ [Vibrio parahaemolyticus]TOK85816.1 nitrate/nitrite two-component system sensor histidine kinase NarQ [Vibrio parahaemolyticus]TOK88692.1 nitrate/nitrite two-component system sensor histidine kinase NarQ [Vibrio parahaemolyt
MFKNVKKSVTRTIASAMLLILLLSVATTGFAIFTLASSLNDAEAVNVAGSMRMQSYRLAHDIQIRSVDYSSHIDAFEHSIYSPSMKALQHWSVPEDITHDYYRLIMRWHELKSVLRGEDPSQYQLLVAGFVQQIDDFVFKLQNFSEQKLINLAWVGGLGLGGILCASMFVVHFIRLEVVRPLRALVFASERIKNRSFDINLAVSSDNEMGILTRTFNRMATDLGKLYRGLEQAVDEKTRKLQHANQSLEVLYDSSKELTASRINQDNFQAILKHIASLEGIKAVKLEIEQLGEPNWILTEGEECCHDCDDECHAEPLTLDGEHLGSLYWKAGLPCPNETLIDNFVQILSRAVYYNRAQRQAEQILLMEERATIARELHDSLAQALSYLKIQVALLKRSVKNLPDEKAIAQANQVIAELDTGLSAAYTQLRELLTTFRLTIKEGSFGQALQEMVETLNEQTTAEITLKNRLSSTELDAHQQVHLLQLIREATLNAIKHAQADHIHIQCLDCDGKVTVTVSDDGVGFEHQDEKINHYGMTIMQERAARLHADLQIEASINKGCTVKLEFQHSKEVNFDSV